MTNAYKGFLSLLLTLLSVLPMLGQTPEAIRAREEEMRKASIEEFIPKGFTRAYNVNDANLLKDLEPLIEKLDGMATENAKIFDFNDASAKPRKTFGRSMDIRVSEDADSKWVSHVWLRMWAADSLKQAEETLAQNAAMMPLVLTAGSLTGREIGELSYHYAEGNKTAYLIFLRRNVVVSLSCKGPLEISKHTKKQPGPFLDDPELTSKCETLAKKIDDWIIDLSGK